MSVIELYKTATEFHPMMTPSDNVISVHDLTVYNLPLLCTVTQTKGATAFDLDLKVCIKNSINNTVTPPPLLLCCSNHKILKTNLIIIIGPKYNVCLLQRHVTLTGDSVVMIRLVVAVKRKLQLYYWKSRKFHILREDLALPDVPRALTWCMEAIAVAFKHDYWLVTVSGKIAQSLQRSLCNTAQKQTKLWNSFMNNIWNTFTSIYINLLEFGNVFGV